MKKVSIEDKLKFIRDLDAGISMTAACKENRISRQWGYAIMRRYQDDGAEGLEDRAPIPKTFPNKIGGKAEVVIEKVVLQHPEKSAKWFSEYLAKKKNVKVSPPTIQKILKKKGLETRKKRLRRLFDLYVERGEKELSESALRGMEKLDPHFTYRYLLKDKMGEQVFLLSEIGYLRDSRKRIDFDIIIDFCGNTVFIIFNYMNLLNPGLVNIFLNNRPLQEITMWHRNRLTDVLIALKTLIYNKLDIPLKVVVIPVEDEQVASDVPVLREQAKSLNIEIGHIPAEQFFNIPYVRDFKKLFRREVKKSILSKISYDRRMPYTSVLEIEKLLNEYLSEYNQNRRIHTFPHLGKSPFEYIFHQQNPTVAIPMAVRIDRIIEGGRQLVSDEMLEKQRNIIKRIDNRKKRRYASI